MNEDVLTDSLDLLDAYSAQVTVLLDYIGTAESLEAFATEHGCEAKVVVHIGPAGWPVVEFKGRATDVHSLLEAY